MDYRSMDRLLEALGEGMASRLPALEPTPTPETAPAVRPRRAIVVRWARAAAVAVVPLLGLALLFGSDVVGFLPVYAAFLLVASVRDALETGLGWALAWSTAALGLLALVPLPGPEAASFVASPGIASVLAGFAAFLTGGLFVAALAAFRRGRRRSDLPLAQTAWWGAGAGAVAAGACLVAGLVAGIAVTSWFVPAVLFGLPALGAGSAAASARFDRLVDEGGAWPARIRAVLRVSLGWGLGYGMVGLVVAIPSWIVVGLISGAGFAGVLRLAEHRGLLEEPSLGRVSVMATIGAAISALVALPLYLVLSRVDAEIDVLFSLVVLGVIGACAAVVTVAIRRLHEDDGEGDAWTRRLREGPDLLEDE